MRIIAAMSGGVDSSVAAALIRQAGHETLGVCLDLRPVEDGGAGGSCQVGAGAEDARLAAEAIGVPLAVLDWRELFERRIVEPFARAYLAGETPNPCVRCNALIKFGALLEWGRAEGYGHIATGHYARAEFDPSAARWRLLRARCRAKDQSYYLSGLSQDQLAHAIFPLGEMADKEETRRRAREWRLPVAERAESQDACLAGGDYRAFLARRLRGAPALAPGPIVSARGEVLGRHTGIAHYTVGQRRGLGGSHPRPLYVIRIDARADTIVVGERQELLSRRFAVGGVNWVSIAPPSRPLRALAQIRYQHRGAAAEICPSGPEMVEVVFDHPQLAVTPGQAAVFYDGEAVLAGGWIRREDPSGG